MRAGKHTLVIALLVLVSSLFGGSGDRGHHGSRKVVHASHRSSHFSLFSRHFVPVLTAGAAADHTTRHGEKRHGKSLVSQAIVADVPIVVRPDFAYCQHHYSLFLPPGCISQFFGHFSLRGPPALA